MIRLFTLAVDDDAGVREVVDQSLARDPLFAVRACAAGRDAIRTAIEWRPDLILLDIMMPVMDGPTTLAELRADRRTATIPVVFMTARPQTREHQRYRSLGAAGVITKPFDPLQLPVLVRDCVSLATAPSEDFLQSLDSASTALAACRADLARARDRRTLTEIKRLARALADTGHHNGFAGIALESTALAEAATVELAGQGAPISVEHAFDRVLARIAVH